MCNALDDLVSAERKERENKEKAMSSDLFSESEDNHGTKAEDTDSSGNGTRFAHRMGIFSLDFPDSPRVPKGKGKKSKDTTAGVKTGRSDADGSEFDAGFTQSGRQGTFGSPSLKQRESDITRTNSKVTTIMPTQTQELTVSIPTVCNSDSDFHTQPTGFITNRKKKRRSSSLCNKDHLKRAKVEVPVSDERGG